MTTMPAVLPNPGSLDGLAGIYAHRITAALPLKWAQRISMHDGRGQICWQSPGVWGPPDLDAVRLALERFVGQSAPSRADHELPDRRTAVLVRAADLGNVFRGFVMLVVDNDRLRGKGKSAHDLPVPVLRAAHDWAVRLAAAPTVYPHAPAQSSELSALQTDRLIAFGPTGNEPQVEEFFARLRAFPLALAVQPLSPLQRGLRIRRYEVLLRQASAATPSSAAPLALLRDADGMGLGSVLDRRVTGALIVYLAERSAVFADEPAQFSINLSVSSVADPNFMHFIELCIGKAGLAPALLAFEVDQALWRKERNSMQRLSQSLDALGAGLVIDNATLDEHTVELLSLPGVRLTKIDRGLTHELASSRTARMRIAGIAQIARVAGVHTVAKQIERPQEQDLLRALGVDFIQGHAAAFPTPLADLDQQREQSLVIDADVQPEASAGEEPA